MSEDRSVLSSIVAMRRKGIAKERVSIAKNITWCMASIVATHIITCL